MAADSCASSLYRPQFPTPQCGAICQPGLWNPGSYNTMPSICAQPVLLTCVNANEALVVAELDPLQQPAQAGGATLLQVMKAALP